MVLQEVRDASGTAVQGLLDRLNTLPTAPWVTTVLGFHIVRFFFFYTISVFTCNTQTQNYLKGRQSQPLKS